MRVCATVLICAVSTMPGVAARGDVISLIPFKDNTIYQQETGQLSNGAGAGLFIGTTGTGAVRRALLAFDIAGNIPAGSTINSATLRLTVTQTISGPEPVVAHLVLADWGEGTSLADGMEGAGVQATPNDATWLYRFFDTLAWVEPGGDYVLQERAASTANGFAPIALTSPELAGDVQTWLDAPATNFGWMLRGDEGSVRTAYRFGSRSIEFPERRPTLEIDYTIPEPQMLVVGSALGGLLLRKRRRAAQNSDELHT
jgi:hypothetical protein